MSRKPTVVCLVGSTRFYDAFRQANFLESLAGRIVLTVAFMPTQADDAHGQDVGISPYQKAALDTLYLRKIDIADEILVLNVGGYVGDSSAREIAYAFQQRKHIRWLNPPGENAALHAYIAWRGDRELQIMRPVGYEPIQDRILDHSYGRCGSLGAHVHTVGWTPDMVPVVIEAGPNQKCTTFGCGVHGNHRHTLTPAEKSAMYDRIFGVED